MSRTPRFQKSATAMPRLFESRSVPAARPTSVKDVPSGPGPSLRRWRLRSQPCHERPAKCSGSNSTPVL